MSNIPKVTFKIRVFDAGSNTYRWESRTSEDYFNHGKSVIFSLPGAFTPTCSNYQVPSYNQKYQEFKDLGIDDVYCISVNDAFVMNRWKKHLEIENIIFIPDGNGEFTRKMGYLVEKANLGFGERSWRYSMYVEYGVIKKIFEEPGIDDNVQNDPYEVTNPETMLEYLKSL